MVRFGPSGNSDLFYEEGYKESEQAPQWLASLGLSAYEYSFTLGRFITDEKSSKIKSEAEKQNIQISVHAPYYINFCNDSEKSKENNEKFLLNSLLGLKKLGGKTCVVHMGSQMKNERSVAFKNLESGLKSFLDIYYENNLDGLFIAPETMGKFSYIGTVDEILEISSWDKNIIPCFDFGHINCITQGALKTKQDFLDIFNKTTDKIGFEKTNNCHIHFSKIKYGEKGEIEHLTFDDKIYGPNFEPFIESLIELKINPVVICESRGTQATDALIMKNYYDKLK